MSFQMSGVIQPGETEPHSNEPGKTRPFGKVKRCTSKVKTKLLSSFSRRTLLSSDSEDSNEMSRQLASKTHAGKDRSPKGLMSGSPFNNRNVHEILSVHSSDASFRTWSSLSGRCDLLTNKSPSQHECLPNKTGVTGLNTSDPTLTFQDESGLIVPPQDTGDSLQGPSTVTSSSKGDTASKTDKSRRDSTSNVDQSQQDSSSSPNIIIDTSSNVPHDSDVHNQVPTSLSNQDSESQTKDEGVNEPDSFIYRPDYSDYAWDEKTRMHYYKLYGYDLAFLPLIPSEDDALDSEILKTYHLHADRKDIFIREVTLLVNQANKHKHFLCHEWYKWDHFHIEDTKEDYM